MFIYLLLFCSYLLVLVKKCFILSEERNRCYILTHKQYRRSNRAILMILKQTSFFFLIILKLATVKNLPNDLLICRLYISKQLRRCTIRCLINWYFFLKSVSDSVLETESLLPVGSCSDKKRNPTLFDCQSWYQPVVVLPWFKCCTSSFSSIYTQ